MIISSINLLLKNVNNFFTRSTRPLHLFGLYEEHDKTTERHNLHHDNINIVNLSPNIMDKYQKIYVENNEMECLFGV